MCQQNLPKLWCRYEFIVHNHLWNSEIVPQWIQQKISRKVTETDSQKLEFDNCKQQLFTLTMCLPACLWAQIARTPFNYTNTARTLLAKCDDYQFQRLILQFLTLEKNYRIASMLIIIGALSAPRDVERRESGSMFCSTNHLLKFERIEQKAWKHSAEKYHDQTMGLSVGENPDKTRLTSSSFLDPLWFASLCWWPFFSRFSKLFVFPSHVALR